MTNPELIQIGWETMPVYDLNEVIVNNSDGTRTVFYLANDSPSFFTDIPIDLESEEIKNEQSKLTELENEVANYPKTLQKAIELSNESMCIFDELLNEMEL